MWAGGDWDDADWKYTSGYLWILLVNNASVTLALYYLLYFYHASLPCEPLQRARPLAKLLVIKAVVFFCFWQYCLISLLASARPRGNARRRSRRRRGAATAPW